MADGTEKPEEKRMKNRLFGIAVLCVVLFVFIIWNRGTQKRFADLTITTQPQPISLRVELARTSQEIEQGLSNRDTLGSGGMLFILPQEMKPAFWMKDMRFPLDFIWIRTNSIVDLTRNVPISPPLTTYMPSSSVTYVLEVPAGFIDQHNIHLGDSVEWK